MNIAIISIGCPKNQVDADVMCHALLSRGHTTTADLSEADCILVNTCAFIVTGCLAERYRSEILTEIPEVDAVIGIGSNGAICDLLDRVEAGEEHLESYGPKRDMPLGGCRVISTPKHYAYLKIAEGCSNCCAYCAIPLIRGGLRSRTVEDCVEEAKFLASEGVKELILVAQDITAFGADRGEPEIAQLLDELNKVEGIEWIRMLYAYPERITDEFIDAMVRNDKVLHYLDVPIQHIDSEVLARMNRKGDETTVRSALARLRAAMPDITLRTTLITGFPGETEEQFEKLCAFVREQRFARLGCFAYSEEEGTKAAEMEQMPMEVREQRAEAVMRIQTDIMAEAQQAMIGRTLTVICDDYDEENELYLCRSRGDAPDIDAVVCVRSEETMYPGQFYDVTVEDSDVYDLYAVRA